MDEAAIRAGLDSCLLEQSLADAPSEAWSDLKNPFPELQLAEEVEEAEEPA